MTDTIAAISTAQAAAGIGIIRISGSAALSVADKIFTSASGKTLSSRSGYSALFGHVTDGKENIDEAVALVFRAPRSYTGEDVVELSCHGGQYILTRVLRAALENGARAAEAGEFTKRAYLGGKLDLPSAEAVMTLIGAEGEQARRAALCALEGALGRKIAELKERLVLLSAAVSVWIDYPDEDVPLITAGEAAQTVAAVKDELDGLLSRFDAGQAVTAGVDTVIAGSPNVGKSTLMNLFSGRERAIVTPIPGTTRDVLEETVRVGNTVLRLADTAGIRCETGDEIEKIGVELAKKRISRASLILAVFEGSAPLKKEDRDLLMLLRGRCAIAVINKCDLEQKISAEEIGEFCPNVVCISAKSGEGLKELTEAIERVLGTESFDSSAPLLTSERQRACVTEAAAALGEAESAVLSGVTPDAVNVCIEAAIKSLCSLTGERVTDEVSNSVFKNFCVGK